VIRTVLGTLVLVAAAAVIGCNPSPVQPAGGCTLDSDCDAPLVCLQRACRSECAASRDCPVNQLCVPLGDAMVCALPEEGNEGGPGGPGDAGADASDAGEAGG
jgi:hypothetical protein